MKPEPNPPDRLLTEVEAARQLSCSPGWLRARRSNGAPVVPAVKLGGMIRYRESDVQRLIRAGRAAPAA